MKPEITNVRGEREWLWICAQVGEDRARQALEQLGNRRPFPVNVARVLGLVLPEERLLPQTAAQLESIAQSRAKLREMVSRQRPQ